VLFGNSNSGQLAREYGFQDIDGSQPDIWRFIEKVRERGIEAHCDDYRSLGFYAGGPRTLQQCGRAWELPIERLPVSQTAS
jgi:hypothetical protein